MRRVKGAWMAAVLAVGLAAGAAERGEVLFWKLPLQEKLRQEISCSFEETPLSEVLSYFRGTLGVNIVCDPPVDTEALITFEVSNVPARMALRAALRQAGLGYGFADGAVYVTRASNVMRVEPASLGQYDVSDLFVTFAAATGSSGSDNTGGGNNNNNRGQTRSAEDLLRLIVMFTGPQNWDYVQILGVTQENQNESQSREDYF